MKIDRVIQQAAEAYARRAERAHDQPAARGSGETAAGQPVEVHISRASRELQRASALAEQAPEVRMERVQALRASIEAGTYRVPAMEVAARLLEGAPYGLRRVD